MPCLTMLDLIITQSARDDLENIAQYTFQNFGALQVNRYMTALFNSLDKLTTLPTIGRARSDLPDGYQMHAVGKHIIIYHVHHSQLIVMRILHERMDILRHL
jgi:toxin ParE1/3/4